MAQRLALVLSGGGNLGICQVPFLQRLMDLDINPDMIVGTSVGALNGAFLAFHPHNIDGLADVWRALRDQRMWDRNLLRIGRNLLLGRMSLYSNEFLRQLIEPYVTVGRTRGRRDSAVHHRHQPRPRRQASLFQRLGG